MNKNAKKYCVHSFHITRKGRMIMGKSIVTGVGFLIGMILVIPFLWLILCAFQESTDTIQTMPPVFPNLFNFNNFAEFFRVYEGFFTQLRNTLIITGWNMFVSLFSSFLTAYGFARFRARSKKVFFTVLLSTMMLPWVVTMIPMYILFAKFHMIQTKTFVDLLPLMLPALGGNAYNIFLLKQFFEAIPKDLDEAAKIDGCSTFKILIRILLPNMLPIIATILITSFIGNWGDYVGPQLYLQRSPMWYTLAIGLQNFASSGTDIYLTKLHILMAGALIYTIPMVIIYVTCQKAYVRGSVGSAIKG